MNYLRCRNKSAQAKHYAYAHYSHHSAKEHAEHIASFCAQGHPYSDFARPFRCGIRRHSVDANHREQPDEQTERRRNHVFN